MDPAPALAAVAAHPAEQVERWMAASGARASALLAGVRSAGAAASALDRLAEAAGRAGEQLACARDGACARVGAALGDHASAASMVAAARALALIDQAYDGGLALLDAGRRHAARLFPPATVPGGPDRRPAGDGLRATAGSDRPVLTRRPAYRADAVAEAVATARATVATLLGALDEAGQRVEDARTRLVAPTTRRDQPVPAPAGEHRAGAGSLLEQARLDAEGLLEQAHAAVAALAGEAEALLAGHPVAGPSPRVTT